MQPLQETALFTIDTPPDSPEVEQVATILELDPTRLGGDLLSLLAMSIGDTKFFPAPDTAEAATLLRWLRAFPLTGWIAQIDAEVVGFVLVQPDFATLMRATGGGRRLPWQWHAALRRPPDRGRVLFGAVADEWRGKGVAAQLWSVTLRHAQQAGWRVLTCGPVALESAAARFLQRMGARAQQRYVLYEWTPW
jgi:GNAT superfamily N-acetyltransferase